MRLTRLRKRIEEKRRDRSASPVVIVAFGDSVTQGATSSGKLEFSTVYHRRLQGLLEKRYPGTVFSIINVGVASQTARDGLERLDRDVVRYQPDLVLVAFGLNDATSWKPGLELFCAAIRRIVSDVREKTDADMILLTPNFMCMEVNEDLSLERKRMAETCVLLQKEGYLASYAQAIRDIAAEFDVPVADVYAAWGSNGGQWR